MADNINTNTMVGKVIAVLIALLFVTVLAFPIANSLSNMGKDDDGDTGPITYTNTGDHYFKSTANDNAVHTVRLFAEWENLTETTGQATISLSVDGTVISSFINTWDDDTNTGYTPVFIPIGWGSDNIFAVNLADSIDYAFYEMNGMDTFAPDIKVTSESSDSSGSSECSFTVQNGVITYVNNNDETVTSEYTMDYLITADNSGEYVLADTPFKTDEDSMLYVCDAGILDDSEHNRTWPVLIYGDFNTSVLTSSPVSIDLTARSMGAEIKSTATTVTSANDNGLITVSNIESEITLTIPDREGIYTVSGTVSLKAIVPTTVTVDPSATKVTVTATNSGQTYKELDDNSHNIHTETTTDGDITTVTVVSDDAEIMSFTRITGDYTPKICLAFGSEGSVWLTTGNHLLMIRDGNIVNMDGGSTYVDISNKMYDSHTYGTVNLEYFISNDGEYVYSETAMASKTGQIFNIGISLCDVGESYPIFASVQSNGTPVSALNDVHVNGHDVTNVTSDAHYTVGEYVELDGLDVTYSFTFNETEYTVDYSTNGFFVPKTFTYIHTESPDSGSDSNGIGGVASTLVKLVPILLIVGILLIFVMPMINKPN